MRVAACVALVHWCTSSRRACRCCPVPRRPLVCLLVGRAPVCVLSAVCCSAARAGRVASPLPRPFPFQLCDGAWGLPSAQARYTLSSGNMRSAAALHSNVCASQMRVSETRTEPVKWQLPRPRRAPHTLRCAATMGAAYGRAVDNGCLVRAVAVRFVRGHSRFPIIRAHGRTAPYSECPLRPLCTLGIGAPTTSLPLCSLSQPLPSSPLASQAVSSEQAAVGHGAGQRDSNGGGNTFRLFATPRTCGGPPIAQDSLFTRIVVTSIDCVADNSRHRPCPRRSVQSA